jgi:hypothetical protein
MPFKCGNRGGIGDSHRRPRASFIQASSTPRNRTAGGRAHRHGLYLFYVLCTHMKNSQFILVHGASISISIYIYICILHTIHTTYYIRAKPGKMAHRKAMGDFLGYFSGSPGELDCLKTAPAGEARSEAPEISLECGSLRSKTSIYRRRSNVLIKFETLCYTDSAVVDTKVTFPIRIYSHVPGTAGGCYWESPSAA